MQLLCLAKSNVCCMLHCSVKADICKQMRVAFKFARFKASWQYHVEDIFVVGTSAVDCLERLISEMTYYVSSGMLNRTHSWFRWSKTWAKWIGPSEIRQTIIITGLVISHSASGSAVDILNTAFASNNVLIAAALLLLIRANGPVCFLSFEWLW